MIYTNKAILLVEDEAVIAMLEKKQLEDMGYLVHLVRNGADAVRLILEDKTPIDLILMDIDLGLGMDGTDVAKQILDQKDIPVVFLSSHTEQEVVEKTEKITSYGYVVKTSSPTVLNASIKMAFKLFAAKVETKKKEEALRESEASVRNKLKAVFEPDCDLGVLELSDILDLPSLHGLLEDFHKATGMPGSIIDNNGKILIGVGWQEICTKFHRRHPEARKNCLESDTILSQGAEAGTYSSYRCKNGLHDMACPIVISGRRMGNIFFGQFFYTDEVIDIEYFRKQAQLFDFNEEEYLRAVNEVPRCDRDVAKAVMSFYSKFAEMISSISFSSISMARALTKLQKQEEHLLLAKQESEQASLVKTKFLANINHELRTPLNGLLGMLDIMDSLGVSEEQRHYMALAKESGKSLYDIISNILNFIELSQQKKPVQVHKFDLVKSLKSLTQYFQQHAKASDIRLVHEFKQTDIIIESDEAKIIQIISSLLSNAIKFSFRKETVVLLVDASPHLCIRVKDNGAGLGMHDLESAFSPFEQISNLYTKEQGGIGIGLTIAKQLTELLEGTLSLNSQSNKGTVATVEFPKIIPQKQELQGSIDRKQRLSGLPKTALIAEDDLSIRSYLKLILLSENFSITEAADGAEALSQVGHKKPDLILMDIGMPKMSGLEATLALRKTYSSRELPILALTAYSQENDHVRFLEAGVNDILVKPYTKQDVLEKIKKTLYEQHEDV